MDGTVLLNDDINLPSQVGGYYSIPPVLDSTLTDLQVDRTNTLEFGE